MSSGRNAAETTTVVYTSDHGDNVGARGVWGKSNMYEEAAAVPLIMAGPGIEPGMCETPAPPETGLPGGMETKGGNP